MNLDYSIFQQINGLAGHYKWLDSLAVFLAGYFQYFLSGLLIIFLALGKDLREKIRNRWMVGLAVLAVIISRLGFTEIIRFLWFRARPFVDHSANLLIFKEASASFPSGHAAFFFAMSAAVYLYNKKLGWIFFTGSFFISLARIFVGVHYPSDILAGAVVGIFSGWLIVKIARRFFKQAE